MPPYSKYEQRDNRDRYPPRDYRPRAYSPPPPPPPPRRDRVQAFDHPEYSEGRAKGNGTFIHWIGKPYVEQVKRKAKGQVPEDEAIAFVALPRKYMDRLMAMIPTVPLVDTHEYDDFMEGRTAQYHDIEAIWWTGQIDVATEESKKKKKEIEEQAEKERRRQEELQKERDREERERARDEANRAQTNATIAALERLSGAFTNPPVSQQPQIQPQPAQVQMGYPTGVSSDYIHRSAQELNHPRTRATHDKQWHEMTFNRVKTEAEAIPATAPAYTRIAAYTQVQETAARYVTSLKGLVQFEEPHMQTVWHNQVTEIERIGQEAYERVQQIHLQSQVAVNAAASIATQNVRAPDQFQTPEPLSEPTLRQRMPRDLQKVAASIDEDEEDAGVSTEEEVEVEESLQARRPRKTGKETVPGAARTAKARQASAAARKEKKETSTATKEGKRRK